jgi:uncharacterized protein (TIGR02145 family)
MVSDSFTNNKDLFMKRLSLIISFITFPIALFSQTASITNIQVAQRTDGSGLFDITFTLNGTGSAYYIGVESSFTGGNTFTPIPADYLSGDTGPISPGAGKHIIWNGLQSFPNTYSTQAKVKLFVTTTPPSGLPCPGTPTVVYFGQTYNTVQIGTQCWLKENLNIGTKIPDSQNQVNNGIIEKFCYDNYEANCAIYGGLYQWNEMMQYVTTPGVQGICPQGWHIPTDAEWCTVTQYIDPTVICGVWGWSGLNAGGKMKSTGTIQACTGLWENPNTGATNESGFTALPAGNRGYNGSFGGIGACDFFWSSDSEVNAWYRVLTCSDCKVYRDCFYKSFGFSVRCIQD